MHRYHISHKFVVHHPYFEGERCLLGIEPTKATQSILNKHQLVWKQQGSATWVLVGNSSDARRTVTEILVFDLRPLETLFHYVTGADVEVEGTPSVSINPIGSYGIWAQLTVQFGEATINQVVELRLQTVLRYWEYLVVPNSYRAETPLRVRDESGHLQFEQVDRVTIDGQQALHFVSTTLVPLRERYPYKVKLCEGPMGNEQVLRHLECPAATSLSLFRANAITKFYTC